MVKTFNVSMPEEVVWKLRQVSVNTGIPQSKLLMKGLLLLLSEAGRYGIPGAAIHALPEHGLLDIQREYLDSITSGEVPDAETEATNS